MPANRSKLRQIQRLFHLLEAAMGPQHWWPADSAFEVVVGAYLTQNTAWGNVELAMANLRQAKRLSVAGIRASSLEELEQLVRPAGYFRQKAARLKLFIEHLDDRHHGSLDRLFAQPAESLRAELLTLPGIGPETADSICLYAAVKEIFVVDAYTRRIFERHGLATPATTYDEIRLAVQQALASNDVQSAGCPTSATVGRRGLSEIPGLTIHQPSAASQLPRTELARRYNEFHALLVQTAKHFCLKREPHCENCPLHPTLPRRARSRAGN